MKVRELLQTEIWSKRTTRKLLKAFVATVVGLAVVIAVFAGWVYVEAHWLTRGEREAAKSALLLLDSLQSQFSQLDQGDFETAEQKAQQAIDSARQAAWTSRDMDVCGNLRHYLQEIALDRHAIRFDKEWQKRPMDRAKSNYLRFISSEVEVRHTMSVSLHSVLDK